MSWTIAIATPMLSFIGAYIGHRLSRRADDRLDRWRQKSRYTFTEQEKAELIAQRNRMYPLDERIEFARIAVTLARQLDEPVSEEILELASTTLPWESQTPSKYAR